jgi:menaquinol-cytochrome c reductase cytochrome b subunit
MRRRPHSRRSPAAPLLNASNSSPAPSRQVDRDQPLTSKEASVTVVDWIDERTSLSGSARWVLFRNVPKGTSWAHTLGSASLVAFLSQAVTGVFLAMYYRPDASGGAYESIRSITNDVFLGQFVRGMHKWGASVMIIVVFLHMGRVFLFGAYKYPRELTWIIGVTLLILALLMGFTGYLLPFDQRSYWGTVVGVNINGT